VLLLLLLLPPCGMTRKSNSSAVTLWLAPKLPLPLPLLLLAPLAQRAEAACEQWQQCESKAAQQEIQLLFTLGSSA
jgi:hypothetical protein